MRVSPFAPDFPELEFETFQIVHVPFLTGWTVGGRKTPGVELFQADH